ncbi:MAG: peptide chain release factor N(5)-glutamine methyltransferase [Actinomycetota bacterium]|jgi:release factor glutamine methyltransferase
MTAVSAVVTALAERLQRAGVPSPVADAELLVCHVTGWTRGEVSAKAFMGAELDDEVLARLEPLAARRESREPLQHITGEAPFRTLLLAVGPGVLVPRPETELVAEWAIDALRQVPTATPRAIDLGTGTGALALALATEVPQAQVWAVERSAAAADWAERNIARYGDHRVTLVRGDAATAAPELDGTIDVVVTNPPYIPDAEMPADVEVHGFDPAEALFGGTDGLRDVRGFIARAATLLRPGGTLVLEHGDGQGAAVRDIATAAGFRMTATHTDLLHRERALTAVR